MNIEIIHKEHFEHWLFSQEDSRTFDYARVDACLGCSFIKETTNHTDALFGGDIWFPTRGQPSVAMPTFLFDLIRTVRESRGNVFTIADTKRAWLKLFPETEVNIQPAQAAAKQTQP